MPDTPTDAEMIAAVKRRLAQAVEFCREHPRDDDVKPDLADDEVVFWSALTARLEGLAAPGERCAALLNSQYLAGLKNGWNLGVTDNQAGYEAVVQFRGRYLAALHSTADPVIRAARKMQSHRYGDDTIDAAKAADELDIALAELDGSWHEPPVTAAPVSGDALEDAQADADNAHSHVVSLKESIRQLCDAIGIERGHDHWPEFMARVRAKLSPPVSGDARAAIDTLTNLLIDPLTDERDHPGIGAAIITLRADARRGEGGTRKPRAP